MGEMEEDIVQCSILRISTLNICIGITILGIMSYVYLKEALLANTLSFIVLILDSVIYLFSGTLKSVIADFIVDILIVATALVSLSMFVESFIVLFQLA